MDNEGIISRVTSASVEFGWFLVRRHTIGRHRTRKGWFLRMGGPINTKVASLIVHGKNVLGLKELSDSFYGGLATALTSFRAVLRVNNTR